MLDSDMPYREGKGGDECEEEVDEDSEIDAFYNEVGNEYESDEEVWEGFPDNPEKDDAMSESSEIAK
jgi:hypothetical protein